MTMRKATIEYGAMVIFSLALILYAIPTMAQGGLAANDPMVRITSAPVNFDTTSTLVKVGKDVSKATGIKESFITYYWQTFDTMVYDGKTTRKPLFVDLYVPSFFSDADVRKMLNAVANALVTHAKADRKWLFIHTHFPLPGQVYLSGSITNWDTYRGKPNNDPRPLEERALDKFMFNDSAFTFQCLWRFGLTATGASDLGELVTITSRIKDFDRESWYQAWNNMAETVLAKAESFAVKGHITSAQSAYFRASNYFRAAAVYMFDNDPRGQVAWKKGKQTFLKAAKYSQGRIKPVRIPYEKTSLPGYLLTVDDSAKKRPTLLIQTGLDGTAEDLYFILGVEALKRGYNCLVYEGPGQGEMAYEQKLPFRYDWEKVVTPVVEFALGLSQVDPKRIGLVGYSMGGYLAPRALAHEKRIRWAVVDGGVYSVFEGTLTKFPEQVQKALESSDCTKEVDKLVWEEMKNKPDVNQFISQMFWTFQAKTPCELFKKLRKFSLKGQIDQITTEMLVVNSSQDQVAGSAGQSRKFFKLLKSPKTYLEFNDSQGCQYHCQLGAPLASSENILNWLDERAKP